MTWNLDLRNRAHLGAVNCGRQNTGGTELQRRDQRKAQFEWDMQVVMFTGIGAEFPEK